MGYSSDDSDGSYKVDLSWLDATPDATQQSVATEGDAEEPNWLNDYKTKASPPASPSSDSSDLSDIKPSSPKKEKPKSESEKTPASKVQAPKSKVAASQLPLVIPEKVVRNKVLVECPGQQDTDLEGDVGAVGRFNITGKEMQVDLKGCIYSATIVPSNTFFVVNVGPTEAKIEAMVNDFVQLHPKALHQDEEDDDNDAFGGEEYNEALESDEERGGKRKKSASKVGASKKAKTAKEAEEGPADGADA
eukprot:CAMPEP_0118939356 /NCGR_PEP_ID=MMETSP1169-20130426/28661_1 /TAXON_ID=36882 /ORGANISM="Pyramimonas obovata, Strain CCMP722" /LENGTH=247 /DNA_ID=CAMNT_0006883607 /DNA_START=397 /DNA_END=1137 /DNA_ORIENTATION=-